MPKVTDFQKVLIGIVRDQIDSWESSNDFHSPTHGSDITEDMLKLAFDYDLGIKDTEGLDNALYALYLEIRKFKHPTPSF